MRHFELKKVRLTVIYFPLQASIAAILWETNARITGAGNAKISRMEEGSAYVGEVSQTKMENV